MSTMMTVEISLAVVISLVAVLLSAYSIVVAKRRDENTDLKEAARLMTELKTKIEAIENAVLGKPTLTEQVAVHEQKINEHARRLAVLENKIDTKEKP